jgi:hypothetical protein
MKTDDVVIIGAYSTPWTGPQSTCLRRNSSGTPGAGWRLDEALRIARPCVLKTL